MNLSGAFIVVDLGFGDAGKGHLVDFLVRKNHAGVVVRYNGGAQAGHNVVTPEGFHHTFSQFGSGTFVPGVKTILSRHMVIHPGALLVEAEVLASKGVHDPLGRIKMSDQAALITPYHQVANRIRELLRSEARHGSCGVGVGEVCEDKIAYPEETIYAADLFNPKRLLEKLEQIRVRKFEFLLKLCDGKQGQAIIQDELQIFTHTKVSQIWLESLWPLLEGKIIVKDEILCNELKDSTPIIFEGAQGMLIDRNYGFAPYYSWTDSTITNARDILKEAQCEVEIETIGVVRCYAVRHGPGPLPSEEANLKTLVFDHNQQNNWQGDVRYGWLDMPLTQYAIQNSGGVDVLAVTHLDMLPRLSTWAYGVGYHDKDLLALLKHASVNRAIENDRLTTKMMNARPVYSQCAAKEKEVIGAIQLELARSVKYNSHGLTHQEISITKSQ
jgi:adenylosuccinate synthase